MGSKIVAVAVTVGMGKAKDRTLCKAMLQSCKLDTTRRQIYDRPCGNNEAYQDLCIVLVRFLGIRVE